MLPLAIIPARYASTRFPGKPLVMIGGKYMIQHVFERVSSVFEHCYVATDDQRIYNAVLSFGGKVVMTSEAHRSGTDRCAEALENIEVQTGSTFDYVVNIQGDEPFIHPEQLSGIINVLNQSDVQIATLIKQFSENEDIFNPNTPKVVASTDGHAIYFSRNVIPYVRGKNEDEWQSTHTFFKHIGLYAYRTDILRQITQMKPGVLEQAESLEQLRWLENGIRISLVETFHETIAIDTPQDLEKAKALIEA